MLKAIILEPFGIAAKRNVFFRIHPHLLSLSKGVVIFALVLVFFAFVA